MNTSDSQAIVVQVPPMCLNRQAAIAFSSFKPAFFDEHVRPRLREIRAGTSVLYLREELEAFIKSMFSSEDLSKAAPLQEVDGSHFQETTAGKKKWEKRQVASTRPQTVVGKSTRSSTGYDFASALKALKTPKAG